MTGIAVVASAHDAKFAEEVRAGLQAAGRDASVSQSLPKAAGSHVVLIWSAALEAGHAIDAQALIGLWSEDRLLMVRRDGTPPPLGLRDLPSLPPVAYEPDAIAAIVAGVRAGIGPAATTLLAADADKIDVGSMGDLSALARPGVSAGAKAEATVTTGSTDSQEVELEFWRAIKDGNDPDDFELYVQQFPTGIYAALAKRKIAKLRGIAPEDTGAKAKEQEKKEAEEAAKREAEVKQKLADEKAKLEALLAAKEPEPAKREAELKKEVADVREAKSPMGTVIGAIVAIALFGGGAWYYFNKVSLEKQAALTAALESATKASQELHQAQAMQQESLKALEEARAKEIAALKSGDATQIKEAQEAAKRAESEAAKQAELVKQREAAASDARKKAQEAAEKAKTTSKAPEPKAPDPVAKAPEPVAKAPEPVAKAEPPKAKTRSEREREEEDRLARQAALKREVPVAAASPSPAASVPELPTADMFQQAQSMESSDPRGAVRIYRSLARNGNGKAAKRLGEIYDKGIAGISRDYAESLQWYETARQLGESIPIAGRGGGGPAVAPSPPRRAPEEAAKSAPPRLEPAPAPPPAPAAIPEAPKAAAPVPSPVQAPEPPKSAAEPVAQVPESKSGWFSMRGLLIALFVLALIAWRRSRRREKAAARQARRQPGAKSDEIVRVLNEKPAARQAQPESVAAIDSSSAQTTVLIAEVSGSTKLYETAGEQVAKAAIGECVRIMRKCAEEAKGRVIKSAGDEVTCLFPSAEAAADAAIQMQEGIAELKPVGKSKIGIRIGFSCGPFAVQVDGEVAGDAVDVASRLSHVAVKGQIITARDTVMLMSPMLKSATRKITSIQIKGKAAEVEVYELMWQQSEDVATMAAARSLYRPGKAAGQAAPSDAMLFVSYSHKDRPRVEPIVSVIEEMGRRVWMDRSDITGQTGWAGQIVRAIRECRAVVLMASPNSYNSDQVVRELYLAMNHRKTIVPIEIEPAEMPDELQYILAPFQHHRLSAGETRAVLGRALAAV